MPDPTRQAASSSYLSVVREIVRAYQAFTEFSAADIRKLGLSGPEFDVLCTLGNQPGMTFKEIGENTLITKTTLTGVVDRLEKKGFVKRRPCADDRRCIRAVLTDQGDKVFREVFPEHVKHLDAQLADLPDKQRDAVVAGLQKVRQLLKR